MKSPFILENKIEEMIDRGCSKNEIFLECDRIRKTWTLWWKIKRFFNKFI